MDHDDDLRARVKALEHEKIQLLHKLITVEANNRRQKKDLSALEAQRDSVSEKLHEKQEELRELVERAPTPEKNEHTESFPLLQKENVRLGKGLKNLRADLQDLRDWLAKLDRQGPGSHTEKSRPDSDPSPVPSEPSIAKPEKKEGLSVAESSDAETSSRGEPPHADLVPRKSPPEKEVKKAKETKKVSKKKKKKSPKGAKVAGVDTGWVGSIQNIVESYGLMGLGTGSWCFSSSSCRV